ncbi:hypothetical protein [Comamonas terrigena]|uniref:hypothetical protein n=1 Tax=Comamonas terrigena TaxID=32013 RepID=UPI0028AF0091|nr:hypothetical protein [Comamonas terrigena]
MFEIDTVVFVDALETEDEVGAVLRTHLMVEKFLDWTFDQFVTEERKQWIQRPTNFRGKVSMAVALGLPVVFAGAAIQLNHVRNDLAHRMEKMNSSQVEQYGRDVNKLAALYEAFAPLQMRKIEFSRKEPGKIYKYGSGNTRLDFVIASIALLSTAMGWSLHVQSAGNS